MAAFFDRRPGLVSEYRHRILQEWRTIITGMKERAMLRSARWVIAGGQFPTARVTEPVCQPAQTRVIEHPRRRE